MRTFQKLLTIIFVLCFSTQYALCVSDEELREQAKLLYIGNHPAEARKRITQIAGRDRIAADYFLIGNTQEEPKYAIRAYERALGVDIKFHQAYYNIGTLYLDVQNYEKAIQYLKQSVKYNKEFQYGYYNLGCAYLGIGKYNAARKSFESAIRLNPLEADYYYNLGYTYKQLNNPKRAEKAINLYNELIQKRTES